MDGNNQKRKEKAKNTWVQEWQSLEEERKDSIYLGGGTWALGRQSSRENGCIGVETSIVKTGRNCVRDDNRQKRAYSVRDQMISDSFEYNRYDRI
ncbi:hypothetical protein TIFTF001_004946 [Ficus carica]|uniref:Uncharacterized protein n=1 Tax=Ficus carica TaxID=3494 RepID=A0AA87ZHR6_FICCA|nr:hypothetical protein TIFTF001_004946 [Ficus carica]